MARYVDAYLAEEKINQWLDQTGAITLGTSYHGELIGCIEDTPTADVVPEVRCKDCQYCYYTPEGRSGDVILPERYQCEKMLERYSEDSDSSFSNYVTPEWFCADGERRETDVRL